MAKYVYDVCAKLPGKNPEDKGHWVKCGAAFEGEKGLSIKLDSVPVAGWNGWFSLMTPREKGERSGSGQQTAAPAQAPKKSFSKNDEDDDTPF